MEKNTTPLLDLIKQHPELPVVPMVEYDCVGDDSFNRWLASFGMAYIGEYALCELANDERVYLDRGDLEEDYYDYHDDEFEGMSEDDISTKIKEITDPLWVKAIIVNIDSR